MISRFFKKKPKAPAPKKKAAIAPKKTAKPASSEGPRFTLSSPKKLLTAEGWKRLMMKKTGKSKK